MCNSYLACSLAVLSVLCGLADGSTANPEAKAGNTAKADAGAKKTKPKLTNEQKRDVLLATAEFRKADSQEERQELCKKILDIGPGAPEMFSPVVDELLAGHFKHYAQTLDRAVREAHIKRLISLTDEQVLQVQKMRRLWKDYVLNGGSRHDFQKQFLKPCGDVADFLLIKTEDTKDAGLASKRALVVEFIGHQSQCRTALGIEPDPDPTVGKLSPTGIAYPNLDERPTRMFYLSFLERIVALGAAAPEGAKKVLLMNLDSAREIDVQESEFTMYGNTVRILVGTIAWYADPLVCAVTRDHSADRKAGLASAHMSTVPGKHGFTDRLKRMGARWCGSEGAGGGRDGADYIQGLSYGGGHTGPLYSLRENIVGVGRRDGVYTSDYGMDNSLVHPCAATRGELFMPPGIGRADVKSPVLQPIYNCLYTGNFGRAYKLIGQAKLKDDFDKMLLRFFSTGVTAEMDWFFKGIDTIEATGDVYEVKRRLDNAIKAFGGIPAFDEKVNPLVENLGGKKPDKELTKLFEAGKTYQAIARKIIDGTFDVPTGKKYLDEFLKRYPEGVYAQAAKACLEKKAQDKENKEALDPTTYFHAKGDGNELDKHSYYRD